MTREIERLYILPRFKGLHLGSKLMKFALDLAKRRVKSACGWVSGNTMSLLRHFIHIGDSSVLASIPSQ